LAAMIPEEFGGSGLGLAEASVVIKSAFHLNGLIMIPFIFLIIYCYVK